MTPQAKAAETRRANRAARYAAAAEERADAVRRLKRYQPEAFRFLVKLYGDAYALSISAAIDDIVNEFRALRDGGRYDVLAGGLTKARGADAAWAKLGLGATR